MNTNLLNEIKKKTLNEFPALENPEYKMHEKEVRVVLRNCDVIDPEDIKQYIARDGYFAMMKTISMKQIDVINVVKDSGLRGRGGGGFPTGRKWEFAYNNESDIKYIICNADEGDPGAFMDLFLKQNDP